MRARPGSGVGIASTLLKVIARVVVALGVLIVVSPVFFLAGFAFGDSNWGYLLWIPYVAICFYLIRMLVRVADAGVDAVLGEVD